MFANNFERLKVLKHYKYQDIGPLCKIISEIRDRLHNELRVSSQKAIKNIMDHLGQEDSLQEER